MDHTNETITWHRSKFNLPTFSCVSSTYYSSLWRALMSIYISFPFTFCEWWNDSRSRDRQREADVFIEARKRWMEEARERDELSGVLNGKAISTCKNKAFDSPLHRLTQGEEFPLWWYPTCCYCLHLLSSESVNRRAYTHNDAWTPSNCVFQKHFSVIHVIQQVRTTRGCRNACIKTSSYILKALAVWQAC